MNQDDAHNSRKDHVSAKPGRPGVHKRELRYLMRRDSARRTPDSKSLNLFTFERD